MSKVAELEKALAEARAEERKRSEAEVGARADRWNAIIRNPDSWEWRVEPDRYHMGIFDAGKELVGARVSRRVRPTIIAAWEEREGRPIRPDDKEFRGMFYYRTDENILTQEGGGWHVLRTPKLCNDEEWAQLLAGNIPSKFRKLPTVPR